MNSKQRKEQALLGSAPQRPEAGSAKGAIRCTVDNARDLHEVKDLFVCSGRVQGWRVRDLSFQMLYQRPVFVIVALNAIRQRTAGSARAYRGGAEVRY